MEFTCVGQGVISAGNFDVRDPKAATDQHRSIQLRFKILEPPTPVYKNPSAVLTPTYLSDSDLAELAGLPIQNMPLSKIACVVWQGTIREQYNVRANVKAEAAATSGWFGGSEKEKTIRSAAEHALANAQILLIVIPRKRLCNLCIIMINEKKSGKW